MVQRMSMEKITFQKNKLDLTRLNYSRYSRASAVGKFSLIYMVMVDARGRERHNNY